MEQFSVVTVQLSQFFIMMLVGWLAAHFHVVDEAFLSGLSKLLMRVILPLLIFSNAVNGTSREQLLSCWPILVLGAGMYGGIALLMFVAAKLCGLKGEQSKVFQACFVFGNMGFMGIPLLNAIFPENGPLYIVVFTILDQAVLWTYGIFLTTPTGKGKFDPRKFLNPALVGVVLALAMTLLNLPFPKLLLTPLLTIGRSSAPISLIYLGALLHFTNWTQVLRRKETYVGLACKMLLFPLVFWKISSLLCSDPGMVAAMSIVAALPTMTTVAMFAEANRNEGELAIGWVMATSLASLLTLTAVSFLIFR